MLCTDLHSEMRHSVLNRQQFCFKTDHAVPFPTDYFVLCSSCSIWEIAVRSSSSLQIPFVCTKLFQIASVRKLAPFAAVGAEAEGERSC